ncbi:MAG TPA: glycosyltransferase family 4 protein [Bacteroidales bacterium]|jgi:glycosyltransferase involved in cell wall biosynthesis|nr:glycosyltransferase family 4 protein [Bacteroidales bacterium]
MRKLVIGITAPNSVVLLEGQLKYFSDMGYEVYLLGPDHDRVSDFCKRENSIYLPVNIEREISPWKDIKALIKIFNHLKRIKPDLVNLSTPKMSFLAMLSSYVLGIRYRIYTCRGFRFEHEKGAKRKLLIFFEKITSALTHKVICISKSVQDLGVDLKIFNQDKCVVINKGSSNGIPLERFSRNNITIDEIEKLRHDFSLGKDFVFGFVGRLIDRKGINELFEAFETLYSEMANLRLLIVGPAEGNQINNKNLLTRMKQHPGIILTGVQQNVPLFMSVMDVFVLPAWWEGFGNVLIQAAAMGVPVIGTNSTGVKDAVNKDYNGLLVEPKSVTQLTQAMKLLYKDNELRERLGKNGLEWAKNFENEIIWKGMEQVYNSSK